MDQPRAARLDPIPGQPPSLINLPAGCVFRPRCPYADEVPDNACVDVRPHMTETAPGHEVRCHLPVDRRREIALERLGALTGGGTSD